MTLKTLMSTAGAAALLVAAAPALSPALAQETSSGGDAALSLSDDETFKTRGAEFLVFSNWYDGLFSDSKISGVELIHHGVRTATNGDVRLSATPEQWDPIASFGERTVDEEAGVIETTLSYPDHDFDYTIRAEMNDNGVTVMVVLDEALPDALEGKAGFNLEFLPSEYWGKTYLAGEQSGVFPRYASSAMEMPVDGRAEPRPIAEAANFVLAPEDAERRVTLSAADGSISLYDGRNQAQNGWYVFRELIPAGETGTVIEWTLEANTVADWTRDPVISYSQVGYPPNRDKVAVVELDRNDQPAETARIIRIGADGGETEAMSASVEPWGEYLRYDYATIDFSDVTEPGVYVIDYDGQRSAPFRIAEDVYTAAWHPTLDVFFPAQMDHMFVNEGYRVWHGASHLDDALQAPVDHTHHDLYRQGPTTDTDFEPMEHIPGLNVGGWYDAGDYDIRTQSQYATVRYMVDAWEDFRPTRDTVKVDQENRRTDMHMPDGASDLVQQIEHGAIQLVAQFDAVGHAIHGIVEPDLDQYTHLGDGVTKTDNLVYDASLGKYEVAGSVRDGRSGRKDDRWAFTSKSSALNYGSIAALAAASRALEGHNDDLSERALTIATETFAEELAKDEPDNFRHGNTTGGPLEAERFLAAAELLQATEDQQYIDAAMEFWPGGREHFSRIATAAIDIAPMMPRRFRTQLRTAAEEYLTERREASAENPYGVVITRGGWAGSGTVSNDAAVKYSIHKMWPELVGAEEVMHGLDFLYGRHPGHNLSLVSGVGAQSKEVAYGTNRADFSFIAGGVVPGMLIVKPDLPENHEDWPFFWGQNEYVIPNAAQYIYLVHAADDLANTD